jgi:beta-N-acetylhexosaminidase
MDRRLSRLADAVLQPGFVGVEPPEWVRRRLAEGLGSVVLYARNIVDTEQLTALCAALTAEAPGVIIAIDEEAGDVTRVEASRGSSRPGNLALGAADDVELTTAVARHLGEELRALGITLNYAPDADVNNNPNNPVIGVRAFGADPSLVARHTAAWIRGLQSAGVAACAKHFPGHGDTAVDSHHDVPMIPVDRARLDACELPPFRAAIDAGVQVIMTGHLIVPAIDPIMPATLSRPILTGLLREEMGFQGLIVTDAIEMQAVARRYGLPGATVQAIAAGADAVCVGGEDAREEVAASLRDALVAAVISGELAEERLVDAARRVTALSDWSRAARLPAPCAAANGAGSHPGLVAARRAMRVRGVEEASAPWPLTAPAHVVEFSPTMSLAVAPETPWGVLAPLAALAPGTTGSRLDASQFGEGARATVERVLRDARNRQLVAVVRDAHRHPWMSGALDRLIAARPDVIVVEMGVPAGTIDAVTIATYGASTACGQAVAELLAGVSPVGAPVPALAP